MTARPSASSDTPAPVYAVAGAETFLKRRAMTEIIDRVLGKADPALALSDYDGSSAQLELASVLDDLRTLPFLTDRRLVVLRDADDFITRYRRELEEYASNPSPTGVLLIECRSMPGNTRLAKLIGQCGQVLKFEAMKAFEVPKWLPQHCRSAYDVQLDPRAAFLLCDLIGRELGQLDAELQKCVLYVGDRKRITPADVEAVVGHYREEQVWRIITAIAAGRQDQALKLWEEVWQTDRAAQARAVAGVAYTVRRLLKGKQALAAGASIREVAQGMGMFGKDERIRAELEAFSVNQLEDMLCRLLEADVASKTGLRSVQTSIEGFIIDTCRGRQARRTTG